MRILKGIHYPPYLVALARGVIEAIILAAINVVIVYLQGGGAVPAWLLPFNGILLLLLRQAEGFVDQHVDPTANRLK